MSALTVEDRLLLTDLVHRYAVLVDGWDAAGVAGLFLEDGVLVSPDPPQTLDPVVEHRGRAGVERAIAPITTLGTSVHAITGTVLDVGEAPGTARGRVTCSAHHLTRRGDTWHDVTWVVRYRDDYRRTDEAWRFARRSASLSFLESRTVRAVREGPAFG
ncbi:nuclear transport factor 2 family protein [Nocardioides sp. SOB77]|uniref:Nuclear transport factor 2 family protein n=1 Tax=Nocardioides oceani TaxID=3058369 RepID=A0ABT8FBX7_9ACTN|nr:nuclear transport factor 2 family protein [Nocardioides oceani]MDN4172192.1 nuclear transport factor 2 family protein [Nocardioides oceani]